MLDSGTIAILLAGACAGGFINGLAGFGTSLFALGWWLQVLNPTQAVALVLVLSVATGVQGAWRVRRQIVPRRLAVFLLPGLLGIPIGLSVLTWIDADVLKLGIAAFLLLYGGFFLMRRDLPAVQGAVGMDAGIGFAGGVLGAIAGLSGALPTMWLALRDWPRQETRAVLQPYNIVILGISALLLAAAGVFDRTIMVALVVALPAGLLSAQVGLMLFARLSDSGFRRLLVGLMFLSGTIMLGRELLSVS